MPHWWDKLSEQPPASDTDIERFVQRWHLESDTCSMLASLDPQFCTLVLKDFKPPATCSDDQRKHNLKRFVQQASQTVWEICRKDVLRREAVPEACEKQNPRENMSVSKYSMASKPSQPSEPSAKLSTVTYQVSSEPCQQKISSGKSPTSAYNHASTYDASARFSALEFPGFAQSGLMGKANQPAKPEEQGRLPESSEATLQDQDFAVESKLETGQAPSPQEIEGPRQDRWARRHANEAKIAVDCLEEELKCLRAMWPNQCELDIDYPKGFRARVKVQVEPLTGKGSLGQKVSCTVLILIPENYPHSPLELSICSSSGLSEQRQWAFLRDITSCATGLVGQQALHPLLKQIKELLTLYTSLQTSAGSKSARFVVGDPVLACFHGKWYAAQVRSTFISEASERVTVLWDEETSISEFEASELLPRVPPAHIEEVIGQRVLALFYGEWHPARIQRLLADDEVAVFWESEASKSHLPISQTVLWNAPS